MIRRLRNLFFLCAMWVSVPAMGQDLVAQPTEDVMNPALQTLPDGRPILSCLTPIEGMSCIPGGKFIRGSDTDEHNKKCDQPSFNKHKYSNTTPQAEIWMQTYYMDKTEVTTEAYKACVKKKKCRKAGPVYIDFSAPTQPITGINWYDADQFCKAQGKHLATEAEWEKAARGEKGELYAWGNEEATCERAILMDEKGRSCGRKKKGHRPEAGRISEVCARGENRYGLCDMTGNAEEWVADWYTDSYKACGKACEGIDPKGPCEGSNAEHCGKLSYKVVRGGSWYWPASHATAYHRRSHVPSNEPGHHFGFRCAASQEEMQKLIDKQ